MFFFPSEKNGAVSYISQNSFFSLKKEFNLELIFQYLMLYQWTKFFFFFFFFFFKNSLPTKVCPPVFELLYNLIVR